MLEYLSYLLLGRLYLLQYETQHTVPLTWVPVRTPLAVKFQAESFEEPQVDDSSDEFNPPARFRLLVSLDGTTIVGSDNDGEDNIKPEGSSWVEDGLLRKVRRGLYIDRFSSLRREEKLCWNF